MEYIKGATDFLGLTNTPPETAPLSTSAPNAAGAVSANELIKKKELNDEIRGNDLSLNSTKPDLSLKKDLNEEVRQHAAHVDSKPDLSSKKELNNEIRNLEKSDVLHSASRLPDTSAKQDLNRELLRTDTDNLLQHNGQYDSELRREGEQPLSLNSIPQEGINLDSPSISLRPEFQKTPFLPREQEVRDAPGSILPPQMLSEQTSFASPQVSTFSSSSNVKSAPLKIETIQKDVVVHEHIHPVQKEEIQPIIYREREQLDVRQVTQKMHETEIQPTIVQQHTLPAERREAIIERSEPIPQNYIAPSVEIDATRTQTIIHAPIVEEVIKKTIVEEVQPVLERDVYVPTVVQNTQHIYEKVIEAPHVSRQVVDMRGNTSSSIYNTQSTVYSQDSYVSQSSQNNYSERRLSGASDNYSLGSSGALPLSNVTTTNQFSNTGNFSGQALPTGQMLPQVNSSRPEWAHLPANYQEKRPDFIGTSSQFAVAQNGASLGPNNLQKALYNPYMNQGQGQLNNTVVPQGYSRQ